MIRPGGSGIRRRIDSALDRLARAALADDRDGLARLDGIGNAVDGADDARTGTELGMKFPYLQQWRHTVFLRATGAGANSGEVAAHTLREQVVSVVKPVSSHTLPAVRTGAASFGPRKPYGGLQGRLQARHAATLGRCASERNQDAARPPKLAEQR